MSLTVWLLAALAALWGTQTVTAGSITDRPRRWLTRRFPARMQPCFDVRGEPVAGTGTMRPRLIVQLFTCDWCLAPWTSLAAVGWAHGFGLAPSRPACVLGVVASSATVGVVSDMIERMRTGTK